MSNFKKTLFYLDLVSYLIIFRIKNLNQNMGVGLTEKRVFLIFDPKKRPFSTNSFELTPQKKKKIPKTAQLVNVSVYQTL